MTKTETLDNLFLNQFEAYMCEHGFIYVKKYKMFMKCVNELLLQYIFPERLFQYVKGNVCFAIAGSIRSVYCESFDRKNLIKETIRNRNCIDLFENNRECVKDDYEYNDENRIDVMEMAFEDAKKGIVSLFDKVNDINHYFDFCKNINPIQIFGATSFRGDSLSLIVFDDRDDMIGILEKTLKRRNIDKNNKKLYNLYYSSLVGDIAGERDRVINNSDLYAKAVIEAEKRKNTNLTVLRELGLIT